jgi:hypothetical protein
MTDLEQYNISLYNWAYHMGLNTEYHDYSLSKLILSGLVHVRHTYELDDGIIDKLDLNQIIEGYQEGVADYFSSNTKALLERLDL